MQTTLPRYKTPLGLAYHSTGAGEPIVLIHGVGLRLEAWLPQINLLAETHSVYALDMPGHGESAPLNWRAGQTLSVSDYVAWLSQCIGELDLPKFHLVGHSMGALIALSYATQFSDRLWSLSALNAVYCRSKADRAAVEQRAYQLRSNDWNPNAPLKRWFGEWSSLDASTREIYKAVQSWLETNQKNGYAMAYEAFATGDDVYAGGLSAIQCPSLILTGSEDKNSTPAMARTIAEEIPQGRSVEVVGHGHMVHLTAANRVNHALQTITRRNNAFNKV